MDETIRIKIKANKIPYVFFFIPETLSELLQNFTDSYFVLDKW